MGAPGRSRYMAANSGGINSLIAYRERRQRLDLPCERPEVLQADHVAGNVAVYHVCELRGVLLGHLGSHRSVRDVDVEHNATPCERGTAYGLVKHKR
mgnify:CR=1 FL=1